ncbi:endopeptidase La [Alicyclobacillus acidocaldarius]|uniref:Lon protease n=1 Tax=Alicyclobacillus acidocaldarius subsp. acidocaldarius (strain ATCC 27009 / DSM 446 / BCRC 14685 / JCM 5260 / KCTC 1825 / NBRC 15652 / NCIMB 11725 / NRRL B-14509 / 104-IA) TaxID=521098 RepID=C8WXN3_ALIAD|nr:endopeptidase La [Alicyclobacillus acidocaldarius]ACV58854.1 ATP-dependent protease La [Alicyclobacillus acidocaldarius subsp. acidocaldarius DSM 446]
MATEGHSVPETKDVYPLLPLRGLLVFPGMVLHFDVGRPKSVRALEQAVSNDHLIVLASQEDGQVDDPSSDDLYRVGTLARVKQMLKLPNGTIRVLVEGLKRAVVREFISEEESFTVRVETYDEPEEVPTTPAIEAMRRSVTQQFEQYVRLSRKLDLDTYATVVDMSHPGQFADAVASHLPLKVREKQDILEAFDIEKRLERLLQILSDEREVLELERKIHQRVRKQMERTQKEYYLREQMKAIQRELGDKEGRQAEVDELREKLAAKPMPDDVRDRVEKEIARLERIPPASAEGTVVRNYIEWLLALPWLEVAKSTADVARAERILNEEHYGLDKVKERILEFIAVQALTDKQAGPIICLAGPPGVGKTSLARSIAKSLKRPFVRVSLGGVRDEAEIRGHRRTYIGSMPGRILQGMRQAGVINPVFLLDEIDKMASDFRGDPASAMLEVLDPEQNHAFSDHYIEIPYDLSNVLFITTANNIYQIPAPLRDRMEIIQLSGYTEIEKLHIAREHLLPKQRAAHALRGDRIRISDDVLLEIIRHYTREAGLRQLDRQLAAVCRKVARTVAAGEAKRVTVTSAVLQSYLGPHKYEFGEMEKEDQVGVVAGLAWTEMGGDLLLVEVSIVPGSGKLVLTGQLGDVMKESAQTALSYVRSRSRALRLPPDFHEKVDIHIHVPEGAIPKDGPSAGITMATALVSALTHVKVRHDVAMTGEITLRGRVLPIGGLKEKSLAAHRAGIRTILIPKGNVKDLDDVPDLVKSEVEFIPVSHMDEVLRLALVDNPLDHAGGSLADEPWWADMWSDSRFGGGEAHQ